MARRKAKSSEAFFCGRIADGMAFDFHFYPFDGLMVESGKYGYSIGIMKKAMYINRPFECHF